MPAPRITPQMAQLIAAYLLGWNGERPWTPGQDSTKGISDYAFVPGKGTVSPPVKPQNFKQPPTGQPVRAGSGLKWNPKAAKGVAGAVAFIALQFIASVWKPSGEEKEIAKEIMGMIEIVQGEFSEAERELARQLQRKRKRRHKGKSVNRYRLHAYSYSPTA